MKILEFLYVTFLFLGATLFFFKKKNFFFIFKYGWREGEEAGAGGLNAKSVFFL